MIDSARKLVTVGVADLQICEDSSAVLVTYALGSCIALNVYDRVQKIGGMLHYMLPLSKTSPEKASVRPAMFADTGVPLLFQKLFALGCRQRNLDITLVGGARINDAHGIFDIGRRNLVVVQRIFDANRLAARAQDVGGARSRTVRLDLANGDVWVRSPGKEVRL